MICRTLTTTVLVATWTYTCSAATDFSKNFPHPNPDPKGWIASNPLCAGRTQSPIAISTASLVQNPAIGPLVLFDLNIPTTLGALKMSNTGIDVSVTGFGGTELLDGGGLPGRYRLGNFHFHWGSNSAFGSEHTIDDRRFPLEVYPNGQSSLVLE